MSSTAVSAGAASNHNNSGNGNYLTNLGLGYAIAIALGFLILLSSVLLTSYFCCRTRQRARNPHPRNPRPSSDGVILPRIIFVSEDGGGGGGGDENAAVGLDPAVINSYPKFPFYRSSPDPGNSECSICLCEFRDSEMLRMMPDCRHVFHIHCLDAWLKLSGSCPVCRNSPLPTPLPTPLAEVVPLSQHRT